MKFKTCLINAPGSYIGKKFLPIRYDYPFTLKIGDLSNHKNKNLVSLGSTVLTTRKVTKLVLN